MISKELLIRNLDHFPDHFSIDELIDRLIFIEKLEKRIDLSKNNKIISEEEFDQEMKKWFK